MPVFTPYSGSGDATLTNALLAPSSGIVVTPGSIVLHASGANAVEFYDGSLAPLGVGAGLLLTSGTTPGTSNTVGWFGQDNSGTSGFNNGDVDINAVVNTVFQTQSYDATTLSFDFTVTDPTATSVSFDLVFGSDEYPEWVDQFVDSAIVMVNGVNYALFNHDPNHPLSVVSANLAAGYFQDNAGNVLPIEYDGVSHALKIVAPIIPGSSNHIKIGIADTGDHIYDSGIFLANFMAGNIPGSGVVIMPPTGTDSNDDVSGSSQDEYIDLKGGDDSCFAGAGDDIVVAGGGNDSVYGGSGADQLKGDGGDDNLDGGADADTAVYAGASTDYAVAAASGGFTVTDSDSVPTSEGMDTLTNVEFAKFSDGLFAIGTGGMLTPVSDLGTPPANTPGSVIISGIGAAGKTLTATVSDPNGASGAISYQWQVSDNNGASWSDVGTDSNTYLVSATDVGKEIQVIASYTDDGAVAESPVSAAKAIQEVGEGDLLVTLIQLDAPVGASNINPLTTLVQAAIEFGLSPNTAMLAIKTVLGLPDINLQDYDSYAELLANPGDSTALAVEKVAVEVAILTSLSDDDTGTNLTLKILEAAAGSQTLNLADAQDLADILEIDITGLTDKNDYPEPLREIFDRHENIDQATNLNDIEAEWQDFLSIQDNINSTSVADLSIHVNQAPTGSATANLADGLEDTAYIVNASELLQGFSDEEGDTLSVSGLSADNGTVTDNGDDTFIITPPANFSGPVELTYTVIDGQGGSAPANQLFVIMPGAVVNIPPTGTATALLAAGSEDVAYTVNTSELLVGFSDADGDALSVSGLSASNGSVADNGDGTFTITPTANFNGVVNLSYDVTDGVASIAATQSYSLAAVNDAPTANPDAGSAGENEMQNFDVLANDTDPDTGDSKILTSVDSVLVSSGNALINGINAAGTLSIVGGQVQLNPGSLFDPLNAGETATVTVHYTMQDTASAASSSVLTLTINGAVEAPLFNVINGTSGNDRNLDGTAAADQINGFGGKDDIDAGGGDDQILAGEGKDIVHTGEGNDTVMAALGDGNDVYDGESGIDTFDLSQISAATTINLDKGSATSSEIGKDILRDFENIIGSSGNDTITGDKLGNLLHGGEGDDTISGLKGNDQLFGDVGNDSLTGGAGSDFLTGGTGADVFIFKSDDFATGPVFDEIIDFSHAELDKIDLSAIDAIKRGHDNAFNFIGMGAFTGVAGELHYTANAGGGVTVAGDTNGNGVADFQFVVDEVISLTASDFML